MLLTTSGIGIICLSIFCGLGIVAVTYVGHKLSVKKDLEENYYLVTAYITEVNYRKCMTSGRGGESHYLEYRLRYKYSDNEGVEHYGEAELTQPDNGIYDDRIQEGERDDCYVKYDNPGESILADVAIRKDSSQKETLIFIIIVIILIFAAGLACVQ